MFCFWHYILRRTLATQFILVIDAITLIRYIFIFWLQNPGAFNDDFWSFFINLWTTGASFLLQFTKSFLPHSKIFHYNICIGQPPDKFENSVEIGVESLSFLMQIMLFSIIKRSQFQISNNGSNKSKDLAFVEKISLLRFSFKICFLMMIIFIMIYFINILANQSCFESIIPTFILVPFSYLIFTSLIHLIIVLSLFIINPAMRSFVSREIKIFLQTRIYF